MRGALAVVIALVVGACGGSAGGSGDHVTLQIWGEAEEAAVYRALIRAFEEDNPGTKIDLVPIADKDDHITKLTTSFAGGRGPDAFLVNFREYSQFVVSGAIAPVEERLGGLGIDLADYYEQPLEAFTFDGALQCMPQNISSLVVYYNEALFRSAGVEPPPDEWDWDEFRTTAIALTGDGVRGVGIEPSVIRAAPFVWSNDGEVVDDTGAPTRFTLDEPAAREAIRFLVGLVRDDGVVPTEQEVASMKLEDAFAAGNLGMLLSSRRETPGFREVRGLEFDIAPLPVAPGGDRAGILHSDAYCVAESSGAKDLAFDFVSFATGEEGQTITALGGRTVPSLRSVAASGAFLDPLQQPERSEVFIDGIEHIRRTPVIFTWPEVEDVAKEYLTRLFYEDSYSIDDFLIDLERETGSLFEEGSP